MSDGMTLGNVLLDIQAGKSFQTAEVLARPDELGVLKVSAVTWSEFRADEAKALTEPYEPAESHKIKKADFLISRANTKQFVGAVVLVDKDYPFRLLSDKTLRLVVDEGRVSKEFLLFALRSAGARKHIEHFATGTSDSMRNISQGVITSIPLRLPGLGEQRQIAARLNAQLAEVGKARRSGLAVKLECKALYRSIYRDAFHGLLPIAVPPTFADPPANWSWVKLDDVARLESGHTPSRDRPDWWGGDVSWLSLTEIRKLDGKWVEETELRTNAAGIANSSARILPEGTVCFSRTASVGFVSIMRQPMATSQDFANWICTGRLNPEFLMHALIAARAYLRELATGATHKTIYMPTLKSFYICMPDRSTQDRLVRMVNEQLAAQQEMFNAALNTLSEVECLSGRILAQVFEV